MATRDEELQRNYLDINQRTPLDVIRERSVRPALPDAPAEPDLRTQREIDEASKPYIRPNFNVRGFQQQTVNDRVVPLMGPNAGPPISAMLPKEDREAQAYTRPPYTVPVNRSDDYQTTMPAASPSPAIAPASFTATNAPAQFVPSLRDQINEGIMKDFEQGVDRGLPYIGGGGGRIVRSIAQSAPSQINTDDPRQLRVASFANQVGVDPALALAFAGRESGFNTNAVGPATRSGEKAMGDMQIMPKTFQYVNERYMGGRGNIDNPDDRTIAGLHYLKEQFQRFGGNVRDTALAYFGGPGNVAAFQSGINRTDGAPGRAGTPSSAYAQSIVDRYEQLTGGKAGPSQGTQSVQDQTATDGSPLRQPIEIIRGLQRTAFDPLAQQEFVMAPPGTPPQLAMLSTLAQRGMLPPGSIQQLISDQGRLAQESMQQAGQTRRQEMAGQKAVDVANINADAQGDSVNRATGRALAALIQGKEPAEQLKIIQQVARGDKDRFSVLTLPDVELQTGNPLDPIKTRKGGQVVRDNQTGEFFAPPQPKPDVDPRAMRADAESAIRRGASKDAVNARLRQMGLEPIK